VLDWCSQFAANGHPTTLLAYDIADVPREWLTPRAGLPRVLELPRPRRLGWLSPSALQAAYPIIDRADVLHLHGPWTIGNHQLASLARRTNTPYIVSTHGMLDDWAMAQKRFKKRAFYLLFGRRFLRRAARIHCTAEEEQRQSSRWLGDAPVVVAPYLVDLKPFHDLPQRTQPLQTPGRKPILLFLSRLHHKKGLEVLIDAVAELRRRGVQVQLLIAGRGEARYEQQLRDRVARSGLSGCATFLGMVTGSHKLSLIQSADLMVLPTSQENFGLALIEASACGTAVVTTRGVDIWQELQSAGAAIAERSPKAFADAIEQLLRDPQDIYRRGKTAREWVFRTLDPQKLLSQYQSLYQSVCATP
jgi:glycosyltransferase involved in cell wall biosynthesis